MSTSKEPISAELEVLPPSTLELLQRAEIDVQIATAHKFPRSLEKYKANAIGMATLDDETAASCIYRRPVGKENGKPIYAEGLSIRTAEIVGACFGNLRVYATIIEQTPRFVKARGMAHDLESNFAASSEVIEPTVKRDGTPYDERMRAVIAKAALSKARRDATFMVVPKALARPIEEAVRKVLVGDAKTLEKRRAAVVQWINKLGIDPARVYSALGVAGDAELTAAHLETLTGLRTAIKDGDASIDDAFPASIPQGKVGTQKTASELAAEEKQQAQQKPEGPDAVALVNQILQKAKSELSAGKSVVLNALKSKGWLKDDEALDDLDAKAAADILAGFDELADAIKNPGGEV